MIHRKATTTAKGVNREARTAEVVFSSEDPIEDFPGFFQILSHDADAVDLGRLADGAAVLVNHDYSDHVGVVDRAKLSDDRKGRALLRFGQSARAQEIFSDVADGIRRFVSVGAKIIRAELDEEASSEERTVVRITRWQPVEISVVPVPADPGAMVGRSAQQQKVTVVEDNSAQLAQASKQGQSDALRAANEIMAIGEEFGIMEVCREFITAGKVSDSDILDLKRKGLDAYLKRKEKELEDAKTADPATNLGLSEPERKRFSVTRALNAQLENNWKGAEFELECSREISKVLDREPRGIFIPHDIQTRSYQHAGPRLQREMTTGGAGTGAELVGTMHDWGNFIEQLRNNVVAISAGATMLPGLRQNLDIPEKDGAATFAWLAESGTVTLSDLGTGTVSLSPKTLAGGVQATRRMMKQSLPAVDDLIMQDLAQGAAETVDLGILTGSGASNQPTGVANQTGVNTQVVNPAGQPTWAEVVGFETALGTDNALRGSLAWVTTSAVVGFLKTAEKSSGSGRFIMEAEANSMFGPRGTLNGYPVYITNAVAAGTMLFGNWSEALVGMWGVLDLRPDPYTAADSDALIIRAFQDMDVAVRHSVSFCKNVLT